MKSRASFKSIIKFFNDVSGIIDEIFNEECEIISNQTYYEPAVDIFELEDKIFLIMELPGVEKKDLSIAIGPNMVIVKGVRRDPEIVRRGVTFYNMEIPYGHFKRRLFLPARISTKSVMINLKNGILTMSFNKDKKNIKILKIE